MSHSHFARVIIDRVDVARTNRDIRRLDALLSVVNETIISSSPQFTYDENLIDLSEYISIVIASLGDGPAAEDAAKLAADYRWGLSA